MSTFSGMDPNLVAVGSLLVKATAVLGFAALGAHLLSRSSAAARHTVWTIALGVLLVLPLAQVLLPELHAPRWLGIETVRESALEPAREIVPQNADGALAPPVPRAGITGTVGDEAVSPTRSRWWTPFGVALFVWSVGALLVLLRIVMDRRALRRAARAVSETSDPQWKALVAAVAKELGVARPVRILLGPPGTPPMTWGTLHPVVLLPRDAASWSEEERRMVLVHEIAHVQRFDCLIQDASRIVCMLYWFHPAVWLAAQRLRVERERACDDLVIASGAAATRYAEQLVHVVRSTRATGFWLGSPAPSTAEGSGLEERIRSILDGGTNRRAPTRRFHLSAAALAVAVAVPLAALAPGQAPSAGEPEKRPEPTASASHPTSKPASSESEDPIASESSLDGAWSRAMDSMEQKAVWIAFGIPFLKDSPEEILFSDSGEGHFNEIGRKGKTLAQRYGFEESDAVLLFRIPRGRSKPDVPFDRIAIRSGNLSFEDGGLKVTSLGRPDVRESFEMLLDFFQDLPDDQRARVAVMAIALHELDETAPVLRQILDGERSGRIRSQAAEGLARHPGPLALRSLVSHAKKDRDQEVRRESAEAVGDLRYEPATDALIDLVHELDNENVRAEAVESLGMRPADRVVPVLVALSEEDPSESVRCEAVETLGDLPDRAGLPALRRIVQDSPSERVRNEAYETMNEMVKRAKEQSEHGESRTN